MVKRTCGEKKKSIVPEYFLTKIYKKLSVLYSRVTSCWCEQSWVFICSGKSEKLLVMFRYCHYFCSFGISFCFFSGFELPQGCWESGLC